MLQQDPRLIRADGLAEPGRRCPRCGSGRLAEDELEAVPGWSRWTCCDCGGPAGMAESPAHTPEWAEATRLGFGQFKGGAIGGVARTAKGRRWLCWMIETVAADFAPVAIVAAKIVLGDLAPPGPLDRDGPGCPRCGSTATRVIRLQGGPHHAKLACVGCGRTHRFLPHPRPRSR